jgi:mRNA-degrading endonuclease YafQ of YafQ-DinJ toxin-antitoxin module
MSLFKNNINHPSLKIYKLKGDKQNFWSFSIEGDLRIIYIL